MWPLKSQNNLDLQVVHQKPSVCTLSCSSWNLYDALSKCDQSYRLQQGDKTFLYSTFIDLLIMRPWTWNGTTETIALHIDLLYVIFIQCFCQSLNRDLGSIKDQTWHLIGGLTDRWTSNIQGKNDMSAPLNVGGGGKLNRDQKRSTIHLFVYRYFIYPDTLKVVLPQIWLANF